MNVSHFLSCLAVAVFLGGCASHCHCERPAPLPREPVVWDADDWETRLAAADAMSFPPDRDKAYGTASTSSLGSRTQANTSLWFVDSYVAAAPLGDQLGARPLSPGVAQTTCLAALHAPYPIPRILRSTHAPHFAPHNPRPVGHISCPTSRCPVGRFPVAAVGRNVERICSPQHTSSASRGAPLISPGAHHRLCRVPDRRDFRGFRRVGSTDFRFVFASRSARTAANPSRFSERFGGLKNRPFCAGFSGVSRFIHARRRLRRQAAWR